MSWHAWVGGVRQGAPRLREDMLFEHSLVLLNALGDFPLEIFIEGISHISNVKKKKIVPESPFRAKHERIEGRVLKPLLIQ